MTAAGPGTPPPRGRRQPLRPAVSTPRDRPLPFSMPMTDPIKIQRALLSVSDKTGLIPFAKKLAEHGVTLISTGGTARQLQEAGLDVVPIDDVTDFPEMMDGRVKTLHPRVHGGLLALRDNAEHRQAMQQHGIQPIDLVCVNLYPFEATVAKPGVTVEDAIENIDIGGPSMIRSAAKNHRFVTVVTDPAQYEQVAAELDRHAGGTTIELRKNLAVAAFTHTAAYDTAISTWLGRSFGSPMPDDLVLRLRKHPVDLRYGENPHQQAALYTDPTLDEATVARFRQLHGIPMGFCNFYDANGALELVKEIDADEFAAAAIIKHANPCGFAIDPDLPTAFRKAYEGDPLAAFGGILAVNRPIDLPTAQAIGEGKKFLHVILAPAYDPDAADFLAKRWKDVRIIDVGPLPSPGQRSPADLDIRKVTAGLLVQDRDLAPFQPEQWQHVAGPAPSPDLSRQLRLAMICAKHLKSNAVCIVNHDMLVGGGMGQVDRMMASKLAVERAGDRATGGVAGSDAFFPFPDGPQLLIDAGVTAIVQPGGSKGDDKVIDACNAANTTMLFTGRRHFRH